MDTQETPLPPKQDSPVTWHAIIWVLLTLAISSMAQPTGRWCGLEIPRKYRVYMCISPIFCLADVLSIICSVLLTRYMFHISISEAVVFVDYHRCRRSKREQTDEQNIGRPGPESGPRWLFFVIGTLPALVKAVAFSGLTWSKSWGLMFSVSYFLIESVNIVTSHTSPELPNSLPAALGYSVDRWDLDVNRETREKADQFEIRSVLINSLIMLMAVCADGLLIIWALYDLRLVMSNIHVTAKVRLVLHLFLDLTKIICLGVATGCLFTRVYGAFLPSFPSVSWGRTNFFLKMTLIPYAISFSCPPSISSKSRIDAVIAFICVLGRVMHGLVALLCTKLPRVARFLQVMKPRKKQMNDTDQKNVKIEHCVYDAGRKILRVDLQLNDLSQRSIRTEFLVDNAGNMVPHNLELDFNDSDHLTFRVEYELNSTGQKDITMKLRATNAIQGGPGAGWQVLEVGKNFCKAGHQVLEQGLLDFFKISSRLVNGQRLANENVGQNDFGDEYKVDEDGIYYIIFFCGHLCLGVVWYALRYDPAGTKNPSWTDVFG